MAFADAGIVVVEVKGGQVWYDDGWWIDRRGRHDRIDPVTQARDAQYALRTWLDHDPRWRGRTGLRWAHALVLPYTRIDDDFATPDAQRWQVAGRDDLESLADFLRRIIVQQTNGKRPLTFDDCDALQEALGGRGLPQRDLVGLATEREDEVERLSAEQAVILQAARQLHRVEVRGGAGSGKTWLAVEQARRLTRDGKRVALTCYSRGLAAWLERRVASLPRKERPAYVGTFHNLGVDWGAPSRQRGRQQLLGGRAAHPDGRPRRAAAARPALRRARHRRGPGLRRPLVAGRPRGAQGRGARRSLRLHRRGAAGVLPLRRAATRTGAAGARQEPPQHASDRRDLLHAGPDPDASRHRSRSRGAASSSARPSRRSTSPRTTSTPCSTPAGDRRTSPCSPPALARRSRSCDRRPDRRPTGTPSGTRTRSSTVTSWASRVSSGRPSSWRSTRAIPVSAPRSGSTSGCPGRATSSSSSATRRSSRRSAVPRCCATCGRG